MAERGALPSLFQDAPVDLWDEGGETLWIRADLVPTPERAKRIAFVGRDPAKRVVLPETILGGSRYDYECIDVTTEPVPLRPGNGWAGDGETWWRCEADHPEAVPYWQVSCD